MSSRSGDRLRDNSRDANRPGHNPRGGRAGTRNGKLRTPGGITKDVRISMGKKNMEKLKVEDLEDVFSDSYIINDEDHRRKRARENDEILALTARMPGCFPTGRIHYAGMYSCCKLHEEPR